MSGVMIIAQISDTHVALDAPDADRRLQDFERTIADINALDPAPDLVVHTGDIVHNGRPDEYAQALSVLAKVRAPVYVLVGNKDDRGNLRTAFASSGYLAPDSPFIDYAIESYPVRLIAVDTKCLESNRGDFCAERAKRLVQQIEADTSRPIAVFAHHPPFEVLEGPDRFHFETPEAMSRLCQASQHSDRIVAVFSGHVHRGVYGHVGDIPATVVPCIATSLRRGQYPAYMETRPVYHVHRFDPIWGFSTEARIVEAVSSPRPALSSTPSRQEADA